MLRNAEASPSEQRTGERASPRGRRNGAASPICLKQRFSIVEKLDLLIEQSGQKTTSSKLLFFSLFAALFGFVIGSRFNILPAGLTGVVAGLAAAPIPFFLRLLRKRSNNFDEFEKQLPEALDFLSRSMRAGHGFSIAMELLASDSPDPLGSAFRRVANDMQLGSALDVAFGKLSVLVPLLDVRFFVSSVLLQQETGGNLSEVLAKLALIIRERFPPERSGSKPSVHMVASLVWYSSLCPSWSPSS